MNNKTMEYQTARDLPFAEAGTKIELSLSEGCIPMSLYNIKDCEVVISKEFIGQLISEGWIEEFKPREWWVRILDENHIEITKNEIELAGWSFDRLSKIIKVREVIE